MIPSISLPIILFFLSCCLFPILLNAAPLETVTNVNDMGAGSLRQAIMDVDPGGEIVFNIPGAGPYSITLDDSLIIVKAMTITGPGSDILTVTSGGESFEVFIVNDGDNFTQLQVTISGLVADMGFAFLPVMINREHLTLDNVVVTSGFIGITNGSSTNALGAQSVLTVNNSRIESNISVGIFNQGAQAVSGTSGNVEINNSTLTENFEFAIFHAGSVFDSASCGTVTINNSTISGNFQGVLNDGGNGPNTTGCTMIVDNSTITDNAGDGFQNNGGQEGTGTGGMLKINDSTISGNGFIGVINFDVDNGNIPLAQINNTIVANNGLNDCSNQNGIFTGTGTNFDTDGVCTALSASFTQVTPMELNLGLLQNNGGQTDTVALIVPSVAIDSAISCPPPSEDQRHFPRPFGVACDSGAFEYQPKGILTLNKESIPGGGTNFEFSGVNLPDGCDLKGDFMMNAGESLSCILPAKQYTIHESLLPGTGVNISCSEKPQFKTFNSVTLDIGGSDDVSCTFTNDTRPFILNPVFPAIAGNINTISAENATSNGSVAFIWGFFPGSTLVNGPTCNGLELGIKNPRLLNIVNAFPNGFSEYVFLIPLVGDFEIAVLIQAVDVPTCRDSAVLEQVIRKE